MLTSVYLDTDIKTALAKLKERDGIPEGESIRRSLRQWLEERKVLTKRRRKER